MGSCCITQGAQPAALGQRGGVRWGGGGREVQRRGDVCNLWLIHGDVGQEPYNALQHCKAIILQLKIQIKKRGHIVQALLCLPGFPGEAAALRRAQGSREAMGKTEKQSRICQDWRISPSTATDVSRIINQFKMVRTHFTTYWFLQLSFHVKWNKMTLGDIGNHFWRPI